MFFVLFTTGNMSREYIEDKVMGINLFEFKDFKQLKKNVQPPQSYEIWVAAISLCCQKWKQIGNTMFLQQCFVLSSSHPGDNIYGDDTLLYAHGWLWLHTHHVLGRAVR
ncbi:hypothetical protein RJ641_004574 [Dillenia turbinata]|uniref:Uncharacterized protein n=1 Tax=Dillenia turbinata TaxID=194707 RepID=A0AAN8ZD31_9MAGN